MVPVRVVATEMAPVTQSRSVRPGEEQMEEAVPQGLAFAALVSVLNLQ